MGEGIRIGGGGKPSGRYVWKYEEGKVKDKLPSGYTRIGHIVSNGNQWIDTGVIPNSSNFSIKSLIRSTALPSAENWFVTIGHDKASGAAAFLQFGTNASLFAVHLTGVSVGGNTAANNNDVEIDFSVSGNTASLSGDATYTVTNANFGSGNYRRKSICICDGRWRTYGVQITVGGTLVRNLVPAKNTNDVVGLYDTVGNTFYTSSGTGQFAEGNDPFWTFAGYVVDDNESAYPDGDIQGEYLYVKTNLLDLGWTRYAIDYITPTSNINPNNTPISHSLGISPKYVYIEALDNFTNSTSILYLLKFAGCYSLDNSINACVSKYRTYSGDNTNYSTFKVTSNSISMGSVTLKSGIKYKIVTVG